MGREYELERFLRKTLNCNRPQQLLSFGGISNAGGLTGEGDFYIGVITTLARIYPMGTLNQCNEIDSIIDSLDPYRNNKLNDIEEEKYNVLYQIIKSIVCTILEQ